MVSWLPSVPYPPARDGFWSPVTSTLNWCEEDYYATIYAAEIVNTFTNFLFIVLGIHGVVNCLQNKHDKVFLVTFGGYLVVGIGSFFFHSTLTYPMQLVDELSMIYTTCIVCFATFAFGRSTRNSILLGTFLLGLALFITGYYHYLQDPTFHQNAYAFLTAVVVFRSMYVMEHELRPTRRNRNKLLGKPEHARIDKRDLEILNTMWSIVAVGLSVFLGGFLIWNLDNWYCPSLRSWRREIGLPWGIVLEGHGWWHLMTGTGAYFYIVWCTWLRHCLSGRQDEYDLVWPSLFTSIPTCVLKRPAGKENGFANGYCKKSQ
ncbi:alkaline phytoceramidase [Eremomyces bilateralis CBS 781.70]|uniref:Alkaline phytoceramidase n=1 Tax=Eremomyces bilateralis CBS 781.70 TaxID=1392243 RepID=A0A6G1FXC3_9PEZI|nr:alkaline phytoceramidase [Eremomyces bilateralis CBS 781.70]KAF1810330.1 alkaline phytoceramidase [Eremomyces bilateralis CBS 781.70]